MKDEEFEKRLFWAGSGVGALFTLAWCWTLAARDVERMSLALATCTGAFAVGSVIAFLFTIFGEEVEPLGKIRDGMIALASGIAGITIAKVNELGSLIGSIQLFATPSDRSKWFAILFVVVYFVAGFYFMYFLRKLILNPVLAKSRVEMDRIQTSGSVSTITIELGKRLSPSVLLGRDYIADVVEDGGKEAEHLRSELFSVEVDKFLDSCEKDLKAGSPISQDNTAKAAILQYYRIYFKKEEADRSQQEDLAIEWLNRAIFRDPLDPAFQIKLADVFGMQERFEEAVAILERLERDEDSPQYVQQWLGYFLLFIDGREKDAIRQSLYFHARFPSEADALFNAACGYAQLYGVELRAKGETRIADSENRQKSLELLEQSVIIDPDNRAFARDTSEVGDSFDSLVADDEF